MPVSINFDKAKEETKEQIRFARVDLLLEQDVLFMKAVETGADTSSIVAEKQRLRDWPQEADQASTLEELKSLLP
tara:strand:- start:232 stop:456 length:225 start_codon:yes stop_codon:yes gene_type:complete